ncbi:MAG: hypothetical protein IPI78_18085 [Chitinophagaceae bacterium]|nr:hypothetical protein [Chitinophagaceae bacterium]
MTTSPPSSFKETGSMDDDAPRAVVSFQAGLASGTARPALYAITMFVNMIRNGIVGRNGVGEMKVSLLAYYIT